MQSIIRTKPSNVNRRIRRHRVMLMWHAMALMLRHCVSPGVPQYGATYFYYQITSVERNKSSLLQMTVYVLFGPQNKIFIWENAIENIIWKKCRLSCLGPQCVNWRSMTFCEISSTFASFDVYENMISMTSLRMQCLCLIIMLDRFDYSLVMA